MHQQPMTENTKKVNNSSRSNASLAKSTSKRPLKIEKMSREHSASCTPQKKSCQGVADKLASIYPSEQSHSVQMRQK